MKPMDRKNFIKTEEDFTCENCGYSIVGSGYTNHCPKCLYSKHVDNVPGDRLNPCGGLMAPLRAELKRGNYDIIHKCLKCGALKTNKMSADDDFNQIIKLSTSFLV